MKGKIISVANQKGGVGKTTTAQAMTAILQSKGFKTLIIDMDLQCNTTDTYRGEFDGIATLYDVIVNIDSISAFAAIQTTDYGDIIANDPLMIEADKIISENKKGVGILKSKLDALKKKDIYDYIIIDTNPFINKSLYSALVASDEVLIPTEADRYSIQGLARLKQTIDNVRIKHNPDLKIAGLLLTKFNPRARLSKEVKAGLEDVAKMYDTILFNTTIRSSQKVRDSQSVRKTLIGYAPKSTAAEDYVNFVDEYLGVGGSDGKI